MPLYYFVLKAGRHSYPDTEGAEFADDAAAEAYARSVAHELMRNREYRTAHWSLQVCDDYLQPRCECLFADITHALEGFDGDFRGSVRAVARTTAEIGDSLRQIDMAMADLHKTIDQINSILSGRPAAESI
jgi:hypothetical protein